FRPRTALAAIPGSTWTAVKISTDAASKAAAAPTSRRRTNASTGETARRAGRGSAAAVTSSAGLSCAAYERAPPSRQPGVLVAVVPEDPGGAGLESLHLLGERIHEIGIRPAQVSALTPLDPLHLIPVRLRLSMVRLPDCLEQERIERFGMPVRLVEWGVRCQSLEVEELQRGWGPLGLGEGHLQVLERGVEVRARGHLLQLDGDAGCGRLLRHQRRSLDEP